MEFIFIFAGLVIIVGGLIPFGIHMWVSVVQELEAAERRAEYWK